MRTRFGLLLTTRTVTDKAMTVSALEQALSAIPDIGAPDYADEGMLQHLKTERIIPPYQTRGYKLVELVRVYEGGASRRAPKRREPRCDRLRLGEASWRRATSDMGCGY